MPERIVFFSGRFYTGLREKIIPGYHPFCVKLCLLYKIMLYGNKVDFINVYFGGGM